MINATRAVRRRLAVLEDDPVLRAYGAALALVNALAALHWLSEPSAAQVLSPATTPVCWPFFSNCFNYRLLPEPAITALVVALLVGSIWNAFMFTVRSEAIPAYLVLVCGSLLKYLILFQDFRLTLNHHYMAGWMALAYVVTLDRKRTLPWLLIAMYVWAGVLKIPPSAHWLTGAAMYGQTPFGMPSELVPAACAYVIVLELFIVFGLLSRRPWLFWSSLAQVLLFHIGSFWVVGWFYPTLMFLLLTIFPLNYFADRLPSWAVLSGLTTARSAMVPLAVLLVFSSLQLVRYAFPGHSAVTGQGRMMALNMFDAPIECLGEIRHRVDGEVGAWQRVRPPFVNTRTRCDPLVFMELARAECRALTGVTGRDIDLKLETHRFMTKASDVVIDLENVCASGPRYSMWSHNDWIRVGSPNRE